MSETQEPQEPAASKSESQAAGAVAAPTINGAGYSSQTYLNAIGAPANVYAQAVTLDGGAGNEIAQEFATQSIANRACFTRARGLFDAEMQAANNANWSIAA